MILEKTTTSAIAETVEQRNDVRRFLNTCCAADPNGRIQTSELYDQYRAEALRNNWADLDLRAFPQTMQRLGIEKKRTAVGFQWLGIRYRRETDESMFADDQFEAIPEAVGLQIVERLTTDNRRETTFDPWYSVGTYNSLLWGYASEARRAERIERVQWNYELSQEHYDPESFDRIHGRSQRLWNAYWLMNTELWCLPSDVLRRRLTDSEVSTLRQCMWSISDSLMETPQRDDFYDSFVIDVSDLPPVSDEPPALRLVPERTDDDFVIQFSDLEKPTRRFFII